MKRLTALLIASMICLGCQSSDDEATHTPVVGGTTADTSAQNAEPDEQPAPAITGGHAELTFETETVGGKFRPRHVLAVWVADEDGAFIKTLRLAGRKYTRHLRTWRDSSDSNKADAVTSATLRTHGQQSARWDCRDTDGQIVPDGTYQIFIEFTEKNGQGPVTPAGHISFAKTGQPASVTPAGIGGIKNIKLTYTPDKN